ncbi:MAG: MBL fold metallo-hydrolase [Candidatus Coproplasma sp.]
MKVNKIYPMGFASNSYAITADNKNCILIDCAQPKVLDRCIQLGLTPKAVLLTHGHLDHIGGCGVLYANGADIYCGKGEEELIWSEGYRQIFYGETIPQFKIKSTFSDGEEVELYGLKIKVISTPGHTAGGVSYLIEDCLFTGDTLFFESIGRWDFYTGDGRVLDSSVKKLYSLKGDYKVYTGHGEDTSLAHERRYNQFVRI